MIMDMGTLRITEAELARDIHAVLAMVREGAEILVEQDHHAVAVIRSPLPKGRLLSECIAPGGSARLHGDARCGLYEGRRRRHRQP